MSEFENNSVQKDTSESVSSSNVDNIGSVEGFNLNQEPPSVPVQPPIVPPVQQASVEPPVQPLVQPPVQPSVNPMDTPVSDPVNGENFPPRMPQNTPFIPTQPIVANPIQYTPVTAAETQGKSSKGLKIFCIAVALMILLTGSTLAGYLYGRGYVGTTSSSNLHKDVELDLASKPKDTDQYTPAQVYEKLNESIVGIRVYNKNGNMSDASGVIYTADGYIVTNDHIYSEVGAPKFKIYMHDGTEYNAEYVAGDVVSDLAVLKIVGGKDFKAATFGNSNELFCGENVVALGRPSGASDDTTVTSGIVSLTARRISNTSNYSARLIQTDSAINPGSSGGALVNMYGQVIGITSSKLASANYDNIGFAIPTTTMQRVVTQLISDGKVSDRAKLGITYTELDSVTAEVNNAPASGIYVATVSADSDLYGKISEGDIITKINGKDIISDDVVLDVIEDCRAGDTVTVTVVDEYGNEKDYEAVLGANVGESSYSEVIKSDDKEDSIYGGTFDFPYGE